MELLNQLTITGAASKVVYQRLGQKKTALVGRVEIARVGSADVTVSLHHCQGSPTDADALRKGIVLTADRPAYVYAQPVTIRDGNLRLAVISDGGADVVVSVYGKLYGDTEDVPVLPAVQEDVGSAETAVATSGTAGLMSAADKVILDALAPLRNPVRKFRPFSGGSFVAVPPGVAFRSNVTPGAGVGIGGTELPAATDSDLFFAVDVEDSWDGTDVDVDVSFTAADGLGIAAQVAKLEVSARAIGPAGDYDVAYSNPAVAEDLTFVADYKRHRVQFAGVSPDGAADTGGFSLLIRVSRKSSGDNMAGALIFVTGGVHYMALLDDQ